MQIDPLNFAQIDVAPRPPTAEVFDRPPACSPINKPRLRTYYQHNTRVEAGVASGNV